MVLEGISNSILPQVPDSNPYGLGNGVRYYMLEVDDWNRLSPPKRSEKTPPAAAETGEDSVKLG
jgi:hypothetical protein